MRDRSLVAPLALWIVGCGAGGPHGVGDDVDAAFDGRLGDASVEGRDADASVDASELGIANVKVLGDYFGATIAGLPVVFSAKDGTLIAVETTDAMGNAAHLIPRDTNVTLIHPAGNQGLVTLVGVQPGATLRFGTLHRDRPKIAHMTAHWAATLSTYYDVETTCGGFGAYHSGSSGSIAIDDRCTGTSFDVTIAAMRHGEVQSYQTLTNQKVVDGGAIGFPDSFVVAPQIKGSFTMPVGARLSGYLVETHDEERSFDAWTDMRSSSTDGTGALDYGLPPAPDSTLEHRVTVRLANDTTQVISRRLPFTDHVGFDVSAALVPSITAVTFDTPTRTMHWTTEPGAAPDVVLATISYEHADWYPTWDIVAPGNVTSVTPPRLPDSLAKYDLLPTDKVGGQLALVHVGKDYPSLVGDLGIWLGRTNIGAIGSIEWMGTPADLDHCTSSTTYFLPQ